MLAHHSCMLQYGLLQSHAAATLLPQCSSPLPGVMSDLSRRSRPLLCAAGGAGAGACSSGDVAAGRAQARLRRLLATAARVSSHAVYQSQSHCMRGCSHCGDAVCSGPWLAGRGCLPALELALLHPTASAACMPTHMQVHHCITVVAQCTLYVPAVSRPKRSPASRWARRIGSQCCSPVQSPSGRRTPTSCGRSLGEHSHGVLLSTWILQMRAELHPHTVLCIS